VGGFCVSRRRERGRDNAARHLIVLLRDRARECVNA